MAEFDSDGVTIRYYDHGSGEPIVLIHGFSSSFADNWERTGWLERLLSQGRRVIGLDCRGHGASDKPHDSAAYSREAMSGDVLRMMDHAGVATTDIIGYSMGASIALDLLVHAPGRFRRAVLGGTAYEGSINSSVMKAIAHALASDDPSDQTSPIVVGFRQFAQSQGSDLKAMGACLGADRPRPDDAALATIDIPVLVAVGAGDDLLRSPEKLAATMPGGRFVAIPGCDHLTVIADPRYMESILSFLQES